MTHPFVMSLHCTHHDTCMHEKYTDSWNVREVNYMYQPMVCIRFFFSYLGIYELVHVSMNCLKSQECIFHG